MDKAELQAAFDKWWASHADLLEVLDKVDDRQQYLRLSMFQAWLEGVGVGVGEGNKDGTR